MAGVRTQAGVKWSFESLSRRIYGFDSGRLSAREFIIGAIQAEEVPVLGQPISAAKDRIGSPELLRRTHLQH